jgi:hypothetical protein
VTFLVHSEALAGDELRPDGFEYKQAINNAEDEE